SLLMISRHPGITPFPYTTLFRSCIDKQRAKTGPNYFFEVVIHGGIEKPAFGAESVVDAGTVKPRCLFQSWKRGLGVAIAPKHITCGLDSCLFIECCSA